MSSFGQSHKRTPQEILIVEDDHFIRSALAETLRDEGYDVLTAGNGDEALEILRLGTRPALILLDLMMPVMDGWEFRVQQKRIPEAASIPVLALSANDSAQARSFDADAYLRKPVNFNVLLRTIRGLLSTEDRDQRLQQLQLNVVRILSASSSLYNALRAALHSLLVGLDWDVGVVWLVDEKRRILRAASVASAAGFEKSPFIRESQKVELITGEGIAGRAWERGDLITLENVAHDATLPRIYSSAEDAFRSACAMPINSGTTTIGVLELLSRDARLLESDAARILRGLGTQIGEFIRRVRAEQALRESEERFRLLLEAVEEYAIFALDPDGLIMSWNRGAEHIFGYIAKEVVGQHFSVLYPREDREAGQPEVELRRAISEGRAVLDGWRLHKDGSRLLAGVVMTPLNSEGGGLRGFASVIRSHK